MKVGDIVTLKNKKKGRVICVDRKDGINKEISKPIIVLVKENKYSESLRSYSKDGKYNPIFKHEYCDYDIKYSKANEINCSIIH